MQREDAPLTGSHPPRLEGTAQPCSSGVLSAPELLPISPHCFGEHRDQAARARRATSPPVPLHGPSGSPQFRLGNTYTLLSQACRLSKPFAPVARAAAWLKTPSLTGSPKASPSQGHTQEALGPWEFPHILAQKEIWPAESWHPSCSLMQTHQEPLRAAG